MKHTDKLILLGIELASLTITLGLIGLYLGSKALGNILKKDLSQKGENAEK